MTAQAGAGLRGSDAPRRFAPEHVPLVVLVHGRPGPENPVYTAVCRLTLLVEHAHSLKEKRAVVRKLRDRVKQRFGVALTEVGGLDTWQRAVLGFAVVGAERTYPEETVEAVVRFIDAEAEARIVLDRRDCYHAGDDDALVTSMDRSWTPSFASGEGGDEAGARSAGTGPDQEDER